MQLTTRNHKLNSRWNSHKGKVTNRNWVTWRTYMPQGQTSFEIYYTDKQKHNSKNKVPWCQEKTIQDMIAENSTPWPKKTTRKQTTSREWPWIEASIAFKLCNIMTRQNYSYYLHYLVLLALNHRSKHK